MTQFLRPDSNVTQTTWTNGFAEIDEVTASDVDFSYGANNTAAATLEVGLTNPTQTPGTGTCTVRWRRAKVSSGTLSGTGGTVTQTCGVYQGATLITSSTITTTGTWTESTFTFQTSSVTNWNDLRLRFTQSASGGGGNARGSAVSWAVIEVPDASIDCTTATYSLTTTTTGLLETSTIVATTGIFNVSGITTNLSLLYRLNINAGTYLLAGQTAGLLGQFNLNNTVGTYGISGQVVGLLNQLNLTGTTGSYLVVEQNVDLLKQANLVGNTGPFTVGSNSLTALASFTINAIPQVYSVAELNKNLLQQLVLTQGIGNYLVDGVDAILDYQIVENIVELDVNAGAFVVTGGQLETLLNRTLVSNTGTFNISSIGSTELLSQRLLLSTAGNFSLDDSITEFLRLYSLKLNRKQFALTRINADLTASRLLSVFPKDLTVTGISSGLLRRYPLDALSHQFNLDGIGLDYFATRFIDARSRHFTIYVQDGTNLFIYKPNKQPLTPLYVPTKENQWVFGSFTRMGRRFL
jgi:hypothetical protein